jgi:hypothetical protein
LEKITDFKMKNKRININIFTERSHDSINIKYVPIDKNIMNKIIFIKNIFLFFFINLNLIISNYILYD